MASPHEEIQAQDRRIEANMAGIRTRIVVFSGKGGVGKTTVSVNLAYALLSRGLRVGLLDADITGPNVPKMTGVAGKPSVDVDRKITPQEKDGLLIVSIAPMIPDDQPVVWRGPLRSGAIAQFLADTQWGELDVLIADLPPGTGDEVLTATQKMKPQMGLVVTTPQEVSVLDCRRALNMARKLEIPRVAVIENMSGFVCPHCGESIDLFGTGGGEAMARSMDADFLGRIPLEPDTRKGGDAGFPIVQVDPDSPSAKAFLAAADAVIAQISS